jgi:hypothetical protein
MTPRHRLTDAPLLCALLDRPVPVTVATVSPRGRAQASVVWAERRGDELVMLFASSSAKIRNLTQNPQLAIVVIDHRTLLDPGVPAYAQLSGTAVIRPGEPDLIDRLAVAYGQADGYTGPRAPFETVHLLVDRVTGMGPVAGAPMGGWADHPA